MDIVCRTCQNLREQVVIRDLAENDVVLLMMPLLDTVWLLLLLCLLLCTA